MLPAGSTTLVLSHVVSGIIIYRKPKTVAQHNLVFHVSFLCTMRCFKPIYSIAHETESRLIRFEPALILLTRRIKSGGKEKASGVDVKMSLAQKVK